jgi:hypothetical protein
MPSFGGAMPAGPARRQLTRLEQVGAKRSLLADITGVPLVVIRQVANGDTDIIARQHDAAIAAVTIEMIRSLLTRTGSRGRTVSVGANGSRSARPRPLSPSCRAAGSGPAGSPANLATPPPSSSGRIPAWSHAGSPSRWPS